MADMKEADTMIRNAYATIRIAEEKRAKAEQTLADTVYSSVSFKQRKILDDKAINRAKERAEAIVEARKRNVVECVKRVRRMLCCNDAKDGTILDYRKYNDTKLQFVLKMENGYFYLTPLDNVKLEEVLSESTFSSISSDMIRILSSIRFVPPSEKPAFESVGWDWYDMPVEIRSDSPDRSWIPLNENTLPYGE